jgi:uncharacterized protein (TIGR03437 family)
VVATSGIRIVLSWTVSCGIVACLCGQSIVVTSAASYERLIAPDSLASIFGSGFTNVTLSTALDSAGNLPTEAGGVSVEIDGKKAGIIFVSPGQINVWVPSSVGTGDVPVIVRRGDSTVIGASTVTVRRTAPALFSADATGRGPAAAQNGVTYALAPFFVFTPENPGEDKRTRLALYGTGLRFAGDTGERPLGANVAAFVKARAFGEDAQIYDLSVEYAGPAPGFFGLDQVNVVLPEELDGMGLVTLMVSTAGQTSNAVSVEIWSTKQVQISSFSPPSAPPGTPISIRGVNFAGRLGTFRNRVTFETPGGLIALAAPFKASATELQVLLPVLATDPWGSWYQGPARVCIETDGHPRACAPTSLTVQGPATPPGKPGDLLISLLERWQEATLASLKGTLTAQQSSDLQALGAQAVQDLRKKVVDAQAGMPQKFEITLPDGQRQTVVLDLSAIQRVEALLAASRSYLDDVLDSLKQRMAVTSRERPAMRSAARAAADYDQAAELVRLRHDRVELERLGVAITRSQLASAGVVFGACLLAPPACFGVASALPVVAPIFASLSITQVAMLIQIDMGPNALAALETTPRGSVQLEPWSVQPMVLRGHFVSVVDPTVGLKKVTEAVVAKLVAAALPYGALTSRIYEWVLGPFIGLVVQNLLDLGLLPRIRLPLGGLSSREVNLPIGVGPTSLIEGGCSFGGQPPYPYGAAPGGRPFWINYQLSAIYGYEPMSSPGRCDFLSTDAVLWVSQTRPATSLTVQVVPRATDRPDCAAFPDGKHVPFQKIYYVSQANASGDRLVVGSPMTSNPFEVVFANDIGGRALLPLPRFSNERYCGLVQLAPGCVAEAYVPTQEERLGRFPAFDRLLLDPAASGLPFPGGIIPASRMGPGGVHAWRVRSAQGCGQ